MKIAVFVLWYNKFMTNKIIVTVLVLVMLVSATGRIYAHEDGTEHHALPLEARIGSIFRRAARAVTNLFNGNKSNPIPQTSTLTQPSPSINIPTPTENKSVEATQTQLPISGGGTGEGILPYGVATDKAKSGIIAPTIPMKSGSEKTSAGVTTIFEKQNTTNKTSEGPITGSGVGQSASAITVQPKPAKLILENPVLQGVKETDKLVFKAMLVMSDGTKKDVTAEAEWKVVGPIGAMNGKGFFLAKLDESASEFGEGLGSIIATWKDPISGNSFLANSPIFKVEAYFENTGPTEGSRSEKNFFGSLLKTIMFWR